MILISRRVLAGLLAVSLLSSGVWASSGNGPNASGNSTPDNAAAPEAPASPAAAAAAPPAISPVTDPLLRLLLSKGVLSSDEVNSLAGVTRTPEQRDRLLLLLQQKGILSSADLSALGGAATANPVASVPSSPTESTATMVSTAAPLAVPIAAAPVAGPQQTASTGPTKPPAPPVAGVVSAVVPTRVFQVEPPKREGFVHDIKIGNNVRLKPYGFIKATAVYDTSSPYGNDFPLPAFIGDINGPDKMAEFHLKARSSRFGTNFEWMDLAPNVVVTGKVEVDFEGNFTRVSNRNISSIRSSQPSIRIAYGRVDWGASDLTTVYGLFGQDWTPFGSSTLPNLLETTALGIGFGTLYERAPQFRFGINHKLGGSRNFEINPEFAVVLPVFGNLPGNLCTASPLPPGSAPGATTVACSATNPAVNTTGIENQLAYGERQGTDAGRPELQGRLVAQFQLDKAPAVPPAQLIVSFMQGSRSAVVLASEIPTAFKAAFPGGTRVNTDRYGYTAEIQLPTRFATLIAKYYNGEDLRFYFSGQIYPEFNDTLGLTGTATAPSIDGSSTVVFGLRNGVPQVAPQRAPRSQGGFVNLGLPVSRWFNANPSGRNAGWVVYVHYGYDQVLARDVRRLGGGREKANLLSGQLQYKLNSFVTFAAEESLYRTFALPLNSTGKFPLINGVPTHQLKDIRTEVGPIFSF